MRVLALDTATAATVAAFLDTDTMIGFEARDDPPAGARPSHGRALLGLIEDVLGRSAGGWEAVDRIAVGVGPGTFTGLRIGVASAQALARARAKPLIPISTLASLALGASEAAAPRQGVLAVIDARRNEAFVGGGGLAPQVVAPAGLPALAPGRLAVGDGAIKFRAILEAAGATVPEDGSPLHRVSALGHCRLAVDATPRRLSDVQPEYLRIPDAELNR